MQLRATHTVHAINQQAQQTNRSNKQANSAVEVARKEENIHG